MIVKMGHRPCLGREVALTSHVSISNTQRENGFEGQSFPPMLYDDLEAAAKEDVINTNTK